MPASFRPPIRADKVKDKTTSQTAQSNTRSSDGTVGQLMAGRARNVLSVETPSVGQTLYLGAAHGGARALGRRAGAIEVGAVADLVAIDSSADALCALKPEQLFDGLCFAADDGVVTDVWAAGRHRVRGGRHLAREQISARYKAVVAELISLI